MSKEVQLGEIEFWKQEFDICNKETVPAGIRKRTCENKTPALTELLSAIEETINVANSEIEKSCKQTPTKKPGFWAKLGGTALDIAGKAWALPGTVLGVAIGAPLTLLSGGRITFENNAINFITNLNLGGAITFGNTVIYTLGGKGPKDYEYLYGSLSKIMYGLHEEGHTYQWQLLGPLFPIVYLFSGGWWKPSWLEYAANEYAKRGGEGSVWSSKK